ncbi:MAG: threonine--tRNA ligase, partial [Patescibacteria group bacterium]
AYWKGDEKNTMLTRVYGLAFSNEKELQDYLHMMEEAEKRDHRKLGAKLDLFSFHEEAPGMAFWHDKGLFLRNKLIEYWRAEHKTAGYEEVSTPILLKEELWHTSRHMQTYKENMYFSEIDKGRQIIKPMNCPGGLLIYKERPRSYKELPMRVGELGLVHRHELAGTLHGLFRVRAFTQDDAHIYCRPEQVEDELKKVLKLSLKFYKAFGFRDFHMELSTRPEKYTGELKSWNLAEKILEKTLKAMKLPYKINSGDGAFYGPKIDTHLKDSIGRTWQCGTLQLDFAHPENFQLEYIDEKGKPQRPVMLHRTIYGSLERFIGILIEHYAGALPLWLSPIQCWVVPVGSKHSRYAKEIAKDLAKADIRVEAKTDAQTVGKKIREGEMQKVPYLLIVGDKELKAKSVSVRERGKGDIGKMKLGKFIAEIKK